MANSANPEINKKIATSALGTLVIAVFSFVLVPPPLWWPPPLPWGGAGGEPFKLLSIRSLSLPHKLLVACVYVQFPVPLEHVLDPLAATDNIPCADLPRAQGLTPAPILTAPSKSRP